MSERINDQFKWEVLSRKDGEEDQHARVLHLSKRLRDNDEKTGAFMNAVSQIDGVEGLQPQGPYSFTVIIGRCFNVDVVVGDIEEATKTFVSDLVLPSTQLAIVKD